MKTEVQTKVYSVKVLFRKINCTISRKAHPYCFRIQFLPAAVFLCHKVSLWMNTNKALTRSATANMSKEKNSLILPAVLNKNDNKKRSRDDLDKTDDRLDSLDDLLSRMKLMIAEGNVKIEDKIDANNDKLNKIVGEITTLRYDIQQLRSECATGIKRLSESCVTLDDGVKRKKEGICSLEKRNELLLSGIPFSPTENTCVLFEKVTKVLGYRDQDVPLVFTKRLARVPIATGTSPPILLQFAFNAAREEFFRRYLKQRNLTLNQVGFDVDRRIYVNENLSERARSLRGGAVKLKKSGHIRSVFSRNGIIYVKSNADVPAEPIFEMDQLEALAKKPT